MHVVEIGFEHVMNVVFTFIPYFVVLKCCDIATAVCAYHCRYMLNVTLRFVWSFSYCLHSCCEFCVTVCLLTDTYSALKIQI